MQGLEGWEVQARVGGLPVAMAGGWKMIMQGLDELAISAVGVDSVLTAVELVGQESIATGQDPGADFWLRQKLLWGRGIYFHAWVHS